MERNLAMSKVYVRIYTLMQQSLFWKLILKVHLQQYKTGFAQAYSSKHYCYLQNIINHLNVQISKNGSINYGTYIQRSTVQL